MASPGVGDLVEGATSQVSIQLIPLQEGGSQIGLVDLRIDVPVGNEEVEEAVIIQIEEAVPQARYEREDAPKPVGGVFTRNVP